MRAACRICSLVERAPLPLQWGGGNDRTPFGATVKVCHWLGSDGPVEAEHGMSGSNCTASIRPTWSAVANSSSSSSGTLSEGTRLTCSPGTRRTCRLVATIPRRGPLRRSASARSAEAWTRCSQLSRTSSMSRPRSASVKLSINGRPGALGHPGRAPPLSVRVWRPLAAPGLPARRRLRDSMRHPKRHERRAAFCLPRRSRSVSAPCRGEERPDLRKLLLPPDKAADFRWQIVQLATGEYLGELL